MLPVGYLGHLYVMPGRDKAVGIDRYVLFQGRDRYGLLVIKETYNRCLGHTFAIKVKIYFTQILC